ncbi:Hint domain-containing protein [Epibacterium ulvae]|uniref:Hint domain-containing protein n=1 Tax=Epibacterium ulvae TaxID=1156985 RepID=UPI0024921A3E|nr:Hint domain-containing protein [Epibacterium ulvae]
MLEWLIKGNARGGFNSLGGALNAVATGQGGLVAGTRVASNLGWRSVEALEVGDEVLTFDNGMQPIIEMHRETFIWDGGALLTQQVPVYVPADALHNRAPVWMMPDQGVLIESDLIETLFHDPFAIVPASALVGYRGIDRVKPGHRTEVILPLFAEDQAIYLEAGTLGFSPAKRNLLTYGLSAQDSLYRVLSVEDAGTVVKDLISKDEITAAALLSTGAQTSPYTPTELR